MHGMETSSLIRPVPWQQYMACAGICNAQYCTAFKIFCVSASLIAVVYFLCYFQTRLVDESRDIIQGMRIVYAALLQGQSFPNQHKVLSTDSVYDGQSGQPSGKLSEGKHIIAI